MKTLVWTNLQYECETWTLKKEEVRRIEVFEMWIWRRMEKISWSDGITNEEVLRRVGETQQLMGLIRSRKSEGIGHVMRGEGILKEVMEGRMEGRRTTGRPRKGMLDELIATSYVDMKRRTENRAEWKNWMPWTCRKAAH